MNKFTLIAVALSAAITSNAQVENVDTLSTVEVIGYKTSQSESSIAKAVAQIPGVVQASHGTYDEHTFRYQGLDGLHTSITLDDSPILPSTSGEIDLNQFSPLLSDVKLTPSTSSAANLSINANANNTVYASYGNWNTFNVGGSVNHKGLQAFFNHYNTQGYRVNSDAQATSLYAKYDSGNHHFNFLNYSAVYGLPGSTSYPSEDEVYTNQNNRFAYTFENSFIKNTAQFSQLTWRDNSSAYDELGDTYVRKFMQRDFYDKLSFTIKAGSYCKFIPFAKFEYLYGIANDEHGINRFTPEAGLAFDFKKDLLFVNASLSYLYQEDRMPNGIHNYSYAGEDHPAFSSWTPSFNIGVKDSMFSVGASYKHSSSLPPLMYIYYGSLDMNHLESVDHASVDFGFTSSLFKAHAECFLNYIDNKVDYLYDPQTWKCTYYNAGNGFTYGLAATVGIDTKVFDWTTSYTFTDASYKKDADTKPANYVSRNVFINSAKLSLGNFDIAASHNYHSHFYCGADYMQSYNIFDASLTFKGLKNTELSFICDNIGDYRYEICKGYEMPGASYTFKAKYNF